MTLRTFLVGVVMLIVFLGLRLPGTALPLHQDEYKWPLIANPATAGDMSVPHPPLGEFIYREAGFVIGFDTHFRFVPLAFSVANLALLFYWLRMRAGTRVALIGSVIFSIGFFPVLASLMVDTDGALLPFFLLLALIAYERAKVMPRWWIGVAVACALGFLVKASFILAIGAIIADVLWDHRALFFTRHTLRIGVLLMSIAAGLVLILVAAAHLFAFFDLAKSLQYWAHFASFHHNWFQIAIQAVKSVLYLSPLLVLLPLWASRDDLEKVRPLVFFTLFGLAFYLILFDFSVGALDRYLQFLIVPLVSLAAVVIARLLPRSATVNRYALLAGSVVAFGLFVIQFAPQTVPALYPKIAWLGRIASLDWMFLYPFSGGSGPLTFYISFAFIACSWIVGGALMLSGVAKPAWRRALLLLLLPLTFGYTVAFDEEYLFGGINGSAAYLVERAADYIARDPAIERVVVYNDNGGAEIQATGKYEKRLYTTPDFGDWPQKAATMNAYSGHYLVIDAPPIDPDSFFAKYFATCNKVYQDSDRYMHATVYDCRSAPKIVL